MGFSRDKDGEKLRENSDSYSGMYLSEGWGWGERVWRTLRLVGAGDRMMMGAELSPKLFFGGGKG